MKNDLYIDRAKLRLQPHTITRLLPNMATVMATCVGLSSIRFILIGNCKLAVSAIFIAALLDAMDGRLARLLGVASDFGAELDSLSDFACFGISPAIINYVLALHTWKGAGWGICSFFAVCMSLRLARFNVMNRTTTKPIWSLNFFIGTPAPASAFISLFPLILYLATDLDIFIKPGICALFLIISGLLMISRLPTFSLKAVRIASRFVPLALLTVSLVVASFLNDFWETLSLLIGLYIASIPLSIMKFKQMTSSQGKLSY